MVVMVRTALCVTDILVMNVCCARTEGEGERVRSLKDTYGSKVVVCKNESVRPNE
jgi:hypothetical protein